MQGFFFVFFFLVCVSVRGDSLKNGFDKVQDGREKIKLLVIPVI